MTDTAPHPRHRHAAGPAVAILRGGTGEHVQDVVTTLVEAGVRAVELTTNTPGWREGIARTVERHGSGVAVGVGTVVMPSRPSWPKALSPHTRSAPVVVRTTVPWLPAAICAAFTPPGSAISLGTLRFEVPPSHSWPFPSPSPCWQPAA